MTGIDLHIPSVATERLILRAPQPRDFDAYAAFRSSPRVAVLGGPYDRDQSYAHFCELTGHWMMRGYGRWVIADRETDEFLGISGLYYPEDWPEPEIAWSLSDAAEGRGIAFEAAVATRAYAYDALGWTRVISAISPDNTRSLKLAERMGAVYEHNYEHPTIGTLGIWRHLGPEAV